MAVVKTTIGNALTSAASDHIIAVSQDVYDEEQQQYQSELNSFMLNDFITLKSEEEYEAMSSDEIQEDRFYATYEDEEG